MQPDYLKEIEAFPDKNYKYLFNRFVDIIINWVFSNVLIMHKFDLSDSGGAVLFVSNHQSHFDYLVSNKVLRTKYPNILAAAGDNMNFFPIGKVLRKSYSFFISRNFGKKEVGYRQAFEKYFFKLFPGSIPVGFYIEGGKSRNGFLRKPKKGLLELSLRSFLKSGRQKLYIYPIGISYDLPVESFNLLREKKKKKENIFLVIRSLFKIIFFPKLNSYISIGSSLIVDKISAEQYLASVDNFADQIIKMISNEIPVSLGGLLFHKLSAGTMKHEDIFREYIYYNRKNLSNPDCLNEPGIMMGYPQLVQTLHKMEKYGLLTSKNDFFEITEKGKNYLVYPGNTLTSKGIN